MHLISWTHLWLDSGFCSSFCNASKWCVPENPARCLVHCNMALPLQYGIASFLEQVVGGESHVKMPPSWPLWHSLWGWQSKSCVDGKPAMFCQTRDVKFVMAGSKTSSASWCCWDAIFRHHAYQSALLPTAHLVSFKPSPTPSSHRLGLFKEPQRLMACPVPQEMCIMNALLGLW